MKTTNKASTLQRLQSGIGAAIAHLATARGLDKAVMEAAMAHDAPQRRSRYAGPKRPAGSKLRRAANNGTLTVRHASATDQYWRDAYAKRLMAARDRRIENRVARQAGLRKFAFRPQPQ